MKKIFIILTLVAFFMMSPLSLAAEPSACLIYQQTQAAAFTAKLAKYMTAQALEEVKAVIVSPYGQYGTSGDQVYVVVSPRNLFASINSNGRLIKIMYGRLCSGL